ncbi:MAG: hypothetical protein LBJ00_06415 [Planctomycetaceae bacterium]|nr:hypothetical protein [Planctomycetaceae bacterium]
MQNLIIKDILAYVLPSRYTEAYRPTDYGIPHWNIVDSFISAQNLFNEAMRLAFF